MKIGAAVGARVERYAAIRRDARARAGTASVARTTTNRPGLIALTANEIRHLFTRLVDHVPRGITNLLHWSRSRRRHQP